MQVIFKESLRTDMQVLAPTRALEMGYAYLTRASAMWVGQEKTAALQTALITALTEAFVSMTDANVMKVCTIYDPNYLPGYYGGDCSSDFCESLSVYTSDSGSFIDHHGGGDYRSSSRWG